MNVSERVYVTHKRKFSICIMQQQKIHRNPEGAEDKKKKELREKGN